MAGEWRLRNWGGERAARRRRIKKPGLFACIFSPFIMTINRVTPKITSHFKERNRYLSLQLNHQRLQRTLKDDETVLYSLEKEASYSGASRLSNFTETRQRMQRVHGADLSQTSVSLY